MLYVLELADARDGTKLRGTQSEKSEGRHPVGAWRTILQPKPGGFDKSAFQALLKANGIKYDPNYKRGSG